MHKFFKGSIHWINRSCIFLISTVIVLASCKQQQTAEMEKVAWLVGTWENETSNGILYETWVKVSDNELKGKSYYLKGMDTVLFENIQLINQGDQLHLIVSVENQNDKLPVSFVGKEISDSTMIFENLQHDFPQVITYKSITTDSLFAEISGNVNGVKERQTFPMKRLNK